VVYAGGDWYDTVDRMAVCKSGNAGQTWGTRRQLTAGQGTCYDIAVAPSNSNIVYAVGEEYSGGWRAKVCRSPDAGSTWNDVTNNLYSLGFSSEGFSAGQVNAVLVHPSSADKAFVGTDRGVFSTANGGTSWGSTSLTVWVNDLARDPDNDVLYAATSGNGVYESEDGGTTWLPINSGLGQLNCLCLGFDAVHEFLFVGTQGGGVWRRSPKNSAGPAWSRYQ